MTIKSLELEPIKYNGSISDFRGWMDRFLAHGSGQITFLAEVKQEEIIKQAFEEHKKKGTKGGNIISLGAYYPHLWITYSQKDQGSNREVWYVLLYDPKISRDIYVPNKWATILAIEQPPNNTVVEFLDGIYFRRNNQDGTTTDYARGFFIGDMFSQTAQSIKVEWEKQLNNEISPISQEITATMANKINAVEYAGSVAHFRAWMDRFLAVNGKIFKFKKDTNTLEYHIGYFTPARTTTREVWNVYIDPRIVVNGKRPGDSHFAMILAVEDQPDRTIIEFVDGQCYERTAYKLRSSSSELNLGEAHLAPHEPIGDDFIKIAEWITEELNKNQVRSKLPQEPKTRILKDWFDYLHTVQHRTWIRLQYIADKTGFSYSTVKKEHSLYIKEKGIQKTTKNNQK